MKFRCLLQFLFTTLFLVSSVGAQNSTPAFDSSKTDSGKTTTVQTKQIDTTATNVNKPNAANEVESDTFDWEKNMPWIVAALALLFGIYQFLMRRQDSRKRREGEYEADLAHKEKQLDKTRSELEKDLRKRQMNKLSKIQILYDTEYSQTEMNLEDSFVMLRVSYFDKSTDGQLVQTQKAISRKKGDSPNDEEKHSKDVQDLIQQAFRNNIDNRMLLIIGDPGTGKTTIMRKYSVNLQNPVFAQKCGLVENVIPIFFPLRKIGFNDVNTTEKIINSLVNYLIETYDLFDLTFEKMEHWLKHRQVLLLLDGLDEVFNPDHRFTVLQNIEQMLSNYTNSRVVVTTRGQGYYRVKTSDNLHRVEFTTKPRQEATVDFLDDDQKHEFLKFWYRTVLELERRSSKASDQVVEPISAQKIDNWAGQLVKALKLKENKAIEDITDTPIQLQLIAIYWKEFGQFPSRRSKLYQHCIPYLLFLRDAKRQIKLSGITQENAMQVLKPLANYMFRRKGEADENGKTDKLVIYKNDLLKFCERILHLLNPTPNIGDFYRFLRERSVIMGPYGEDRENSNEGVVFNHKTFMEYLVALYLHDESRNKPEKVYNIAEKITDGDWRQVLQFYMNEADRFIFREFMKRLFDPVLQTGNAFLIEKADKDLVLEFIQTSPVRDETVFENWLLNSTNVPKSLVVECLDAFNKKEACDILAKFIREKGDMAKHTSAREKLNTSVFKDQYPDLFASEKTIIETISVGESLFRNPHELDAEYILIPGGKYKYSVTGKTETVPDLYFAKYPLKNSRYRRFISYLSADETDLQEVLYFREYIKLLLDFARSSLADDPKFVEHLGEPVEWRTILSSKYDNDKRFKGDDKPVVGISWYAARAYCFWLSCLELAQNGNKIDFTKAANLYRLPNEIEWEWAASGGKRKYPWGDEPPNENLANYNEQRGGTTPVERYTKGATPKGLMDMAGNVWEWQENWYDNDKDARSLRGGSWGVNVVNLRCSARSSLLPDPRSVVTGFRVLRSSL